MYVKSRKINKGGGQAMLAKCRLVVHTRRDKK